MRINLTLRLRFARSKNEPTLKDMANERIAAVRDACYLVTEPRFLENGVVLCILSDVGDAHKCELGILYAICCQCVVGHAGISRDHKPQSGS